MSKAEKRERLKELIDGGLLDELIDDEKTLKMIVDHLEKALRENPAVGDKLAALWLQKAMAGDFVWFKFLVEQVNGINVTPRGAH